MCPPIDQIKSLFYLFLCRILEWLCPPLWKIENIGMWLANCHSNEWDPVLMFPEKRSIMDNKSVTEPVFRNDHSPDATGRAFASASFLTSHGVLQCRYAKASLWVFSPTIFLKIGRFSPVPIFPKHLWTPLEGFDRSHGMEGSFLFLSANSLPGFLCRKIFKVIQTFFNAKCFSSIQLYLIGFIWRHVKNPDSFFIKFIRKLYT